VPDGFQIDVAKHVPKSSDKLRNRRPFRNISGSALLMLQPPTLPPLSRSAHHIAAVQKGSASTVAKLLIASVDNRAFGCLTILCLRNRSVQEIRRSTARRHFFRPSEKVRTLASGTRMNSCPETAG
jgi:hypothetical protein